MRYDKDDENQCLLDSREQDGVIESVRLEYKRHKKQMDYFFVFICVLAFVASAIPFFQKEASSFFLVIGLQFLLMIYAHFCRHRYFLHYLLVLFLLIDLFYLYSNPTYPHEFFWPVQFIWVLTYFLEFGFRNYKSYIFSSLSKLESMKYNYVGN